MRSHRQLVSGVLAAVLAVAAVPAMSRPMIWDSWPLLDEDRDGDCRLEIIGNGKLMLIRASGLGSAEEGRFEVSNPQMKPVDWRVISDTRGVFVRAFVPNLWNRADGTIRDHQSSGTVTATVSTRQCRVTASAPWHQQIRVIP